MKVGSKLLYEEVQIKFDFCHGWPTFSWVIALSSKFCLSHSFSGFFFAVLSHIWMKVGSKLLYAELQIKFDFRHGWSTFSIVIVLCSNSVCHTCFPDFSWICFRIFRWKLEASFYMKSYKSSSTFVKVYQFFHKSLPFVQNYVCHTRFPDFSWLCFHISKWKLVASFYMTSYKSSSTFVTVDQLFHKLLPFVDFFRNFPCYNDNRFQHAFDVLLPKLKKKTQPYIHEQLYRNMWQNICCRFEFDGTGGGPVLLSVWLFLTMFSHI